MRVGSSLMHSPVASTAAKPVASAAAVAAASTAVAAAASTAVAAAVIVDAKVCQHTECSFGEQHDPQYERPSPCIIAAPAGNGHCSRELRRADARQCEGGAARDDRNVSFRR